jgi:hypothetical protein
MRSQIAAGLALVSGCAGLGLLFAQTADSLEVRGTVLEVGSDGVANLPVQAAQVSLIEFVHNGPNVTRFPVATVYTDSQGEYRFHPDHMADYWVEVNQEGYNVSPQYGVAAKLDQTHARVRSTFTLVRRGSKVTGRLVDEDGQPIPDIKIVVQSAAPGLSNVIWGIDAAAVSAADGTFTAVDVLPGSHVVRVLPRTGGQPQIVTQFSAGDLETVDQDIEPSYWPGGTAQPGASIQVSPGGTVSVGTVRVSKVPLYRAHVSVPRVECAAGEKWTFSAAYSGEVALRAPRPFPCTSDFLVSNLRSGKYSFQLEKDAPAPAKWAVASVDISTKNVEVALRLEAEAQIFGRLIPADEARLPPLDKLKVDTIGNANGPSAVPPDAEGKFVLTNLKFPDHKITVAGLTKDYYVKEFRLNGASLPTDELTLGPGANQLQIVIDDKPGVISGTVTDGDKPADQAEVRLYPKDLSPARLPLPVSGGTLRTGHDGKFEIKGLKPGEYRIVASPQLAGPRPGGLGDVLYKLAAHAELITVERGATVNADLKQTEPSK